MQAGQGGIMALSFFSMAGSPSEWQCSVSVMRSLLSYVQVLRCNTTSPWGPKSSLEFAIKIRSWALEHIDVGTRPQSLVGRALVGPPGPLRAGSLWAPLGPRPLWAPLSPCGPGLCGRPRAHMDGAIVSPPVPL